MQTALDSVSSAVMNGGFVAENDQTGGDEYGVSMWIVKLAAGDFESPTRETFLDGGVEPEDLEWVRRLIAHTPDKVLVTTVNSDGVMVTVLVQEARAVEILAEVRADFDSWADAREGAST